MKKQESSYLTPKQEILFAALCAFCIACARDPLLMLRLPLIRQMVSVFSIAVVGWRTGPAYPYVSHLGMLTLGGAPYEGTELEKTIAKKAGLVVSLLDKVEAKGNYLPLFGHAKPTQMTFWTTHGVGYHHVPMQDLSVDISNEDAFEALQAIHRCVNSGKRAYLHCEAGQGRSFILCAAYLMVYGYPAKPNDHRDVTTYAKAVDVIKKVRPHVDATERRHKKIEEIVKYSRERLVSRASVVASVAQLAAA